MVKAQNIHCTIVQENALQSRYARGREAERQRDREAERRREKRRGGMLLNTDGFD